jgi:hypothetical protein
MQFPSYSVGCARVRGSLIYDYYATADADGDATADADSWQQCSETQCWEQQMLVEEFQGPDVCGLHAAMEAVVEAVVCSCLFYGFGK